MLFTGLCMSVHTRVCPGTKRRAHTRVDPLLREEGFGAALCACPTFLEVGATLCWVFPGGEVP